MAGTFALLGTARLNNFRLGYLSADLAARRASPVSILLAGTNARSRVAGLTIRDVLNDAPNSCTLTIDGSAPLPLCEQALRVQLGATRVPYPPSTLALVPVAGGSMGVGTYRYCYFYDSAVGFTQASLAQTIITTATQRSVAVTVPLGPPGTSRTVVYRSPVNDSHLYYLGESPATPWTFTDSAADSGLHTEYTPPLYGTWDAPMYAASGPLLFNGALQTVSQTYEGRPEQQAYPCSAIDDTARANRMRPFGSWVNVSATTFAQQLIAQFAPGFTTTHVQPGLPPVTILLDGTEGMSGALTQAATQIGGYFYFEDTDLHLFLTEASEMPDPIDGTPGRLLDDPPLAVTRDDSQLRTRQCGRAHGEALLADVAAGETILPVENAGIWFGTVAPGGKAIALSQRLAYTGLQTPVGGSLVGPGAGPSVAPTATATAGTGLANGTYQYAYTDTTAAGESIASPLATATAGPVTGGVLTDPVSAPSPTVSNTVGGVPVGGPYTYRVSFTNAAGETLAGPSSASVYVNPIVNNIAVWATVMVQAGGSIPQGVLNYRYLISLVDAAGNETQMGGNNINCAQPSSGGGSFVLTGIGVSGDPRTVSKNLYRTNDDGLSYQFIVNIANGVTSYTDGKANASGIPLRMINTTGRAVIALSSVPTGPTGTTGRNIYRTDGGGSTGLAATITNNSATTVNDSNATPLGPLPSANTTGSTTALNQITVSGLARGAAGTTGRKLYRTAANGTQLKLLATIADNTTTTYGVDVAADAALGANAPVSDTSGLGGSAVAGTVLAESTTLPTSGTAPFNTTSALVPPLAPTLAPLSGAGIPDGAHAWAVTFLTASGETLPGPVSTRSVGPVVAPTVAPSVGAATGTTGLAAGSYDYAVAFTSPAGETTPGPASAAITVAPVAVTPPTTPVVTGNGPSYNKTSRAYGHTIGYRTTFVVAGGETLPSGIVTTVTQQCLQGTYESSAITLTLYGSTNPRVTGIHLYSNVDGGPFYRTYSAIANNTGVASQPWTDVGPDVTSGPTPPTNDTTAITPGTVPITLPVGPDTTTGRVLYRRANGAGTFNRVATIADRTTTAYTDTTPTASLGPPALTSSTAGVANQVALSAITLGPANVTGRRLYRTVTGGGQLKLLATLANNSATTYTDSTPDASLGANVPTTDTSGGQSILGGWALIGNNFAIRYTGIAGNNLTGIPTSGPGAIQTTVVYGSQVLPAPALTGVTGVGAPIAKGTPINVWVQREDTAAQAAQAAVDAANGIVPADGIYEGPVLVDERRNEAAMIALCDATLQQFSRPIVTVTYACRDVKTKSGKTVVFDLSSYADAIRHDGPTAYWRFDEAAGAPVFVDASGHGHDAAAHPVTTSGYVLNGALGIGATGGSVRSGTGRFTVNHAATIGGVPVGLAGASGTDPETHLDFSQPLTAALADGAPIVEVSGITSGVAGALGDGSTGIATHTAVITHAPIAFALPGTAGSIELWLQPRDLAVGDYAGLVQDGLNGSGLWLQHLAGGLQVAWYDALASGWVNPPLVPGALVYLVVTVDAAGALTWFLNGVRVTDVTPSADPVQGVLLDTIAGVSYTPASALQADLLDELVIYPYALTAAQVAAHYALRTTAWALTGAYTLQEVTITEIDIAPGLLPRFSVTASSTRFSLDDLLRRLLRASDAAANYSG